MLTIMTDLPDNVLGVSGEGLITGADYETILMPVMGEKLKRHNKISLLYYLGAEFTGFNTSAIFDDAEMGIKNLSSWDKIAFVSDHSLLISFVKFFAHLFPSKVRVFSVAELEDAKKWETTS